MLFPFKIELNSKQYPFKGATQISSITDLPYGETSSWASHTFSRQPFCVWEDRIEGYKTIYSFNFLCVVEE